MTWSSYRRKDMFGKSNGIKKDYMMTLVMLKERTTRIWRNIIFDIEYHIPTLLTVLAVIGIIVLSYALSWGITCGVIKLITLCFGLSFSLKYATGIWLILVLIKSILPKEKK